MPVTVLVTGAGGYLGSALCPRLAAQGFQVLALDIPEKLKTLQNHPKNLEVIAGDAASERDLKPLIAKADVFVPLAALVGAPIVLAERAPTAATLQAALRAIRGAFRLVLLRTRGPRVEPVPRLLVADRPNPSG